MAPASARVAGLIIATDSESQLGARWETTEAGFRRRRLGFVDGCWVSSTDSGFRRLRLVSVDGYWVSSTERCFVDGARFR